VFVYKTVQGNRYEQLGNKHSRLRKLDAISWTNRRKVLTALRALTAARFFSRNETIVTFPAAEAFMSAVSPVYQSRDEPTYLHISKS